jgi:hypothetical protein
MITILALVSLAGTALVLGDVFDLSWNTIDGGGYMFSTGGGFELGGTIGQPDASRVPMTGGGFALAGGFWPNAEPPCTSFAPVDFDQDCDVDQADYQVFESCASGPGTPHSGTATCPTADLDHDYDIDQSDFAVFQRCYSGENVPADPNCSQ